MARCYAPSIFESEWGQLRIKLSCDGLLLVVNGLAVPDTVDFSGHCDRTHDRIYKIDKISDSNGR